MYCEHRTACTCVLSHQDMLSISSLPHFHVIRYTSNGGVLRPMCLEGQTALFSLHFCNYTLTSDISDIKHKDSPLGVTEEPGHSFSGLTDHDVSEKHIRWGEKIT